MTGRVVVVGSLQLSLVTDVDRLPGPGVLATGRTARRAVGGRGVEQARAARRAGAQVVMVGAVGDDDAGRWCAGALFDAGIEARLDVIGPQPTGLSLIARDPQGQTSTVVVPGANAALGAFGEDLLPDASPDDVVLIHLDIPLDTVAEVAHEAARRGARVVLNASPYTALPAEAAAVAEPLVVGEREAALLADGGLIPESLCVTFAAAGAVWDGLRVDGDDLSSVPLPATAEQLDAFAGTLAAALAADLDRSTALHSAVTASSRR